jgi:hypothetical protein
MSEKTYQTRWMWRLGIMLPFWPPKWLHLILVFPDRFLSWPPAHVKDFNPDDFVIEGHRIRKRRDDEHHDQHVTTVTLSPELIERCDTWAREQVAYYRSNGDHIAAMPWTLDQFSADELRQWLASRKGAGAKIDIETCELGWWYAQDADPYGIQQALGEFPEAMYQVGRNRFVRSPDSQGWVCEDDLPTDKVHALYARLQRERESWSREEIAARGPCPDQRKRGLTFH